jgi:hypothetical protein
MTTGTINKLTNPPVPKGMHGIDYEGDTLPETVRQNVELRNGLAGGSEQQSMKNIPD